MDNRKNLTDRLCSLDSSLRPEDVLLPVDFNLLPDRSKTRVDGIAALLRDRIVIYTDGVRKEEIPFSDVKEVAFRRGIGCVFIEYRRSDEKWRILCRSDMQYLDFYAAAAREINNYAEGKEISYEYEKEIHRFCPKCVRPYRPGSSICDHCVVVS